MCAWYPVTSWHTFINANQTADWLNADWITTMLLSGTSFPKTSDPPHCYLLLDAGWKLIRSITLVIVTGMWNSVFHNRSSSSVFAGSDAVGSDVKAHMWSYAVFHSDSGNNSRTTPSPDLRSSPSRTVQAVSALLSAKRSSRAARRSRLMSVMVGESGIN